MSAGTEVRITAETLATRLGTQGHDEAHQRITDAVRAPRTRRVRPALNGLEVQTFTITGTGVLVTFVDGTRGYFSRDVVCDA